MNDANIRPCVPSDLPSLKAVIDATELFHSDALDDMVSFGTPPDPGNDPREFWLVHDDGDGIAAVAYSAPERMTTGTWNALLLAVHPDRQGQAIGTALMSHVEALLAARGERVLLVETSGAADFERTRGFYTRIGYEREALIREYYDVGDDKVVFRKVLQEPVRLASRRGEPDPRTRRDRA